MLAYLKVLIQYKSKTNLVFLKNLYFIQNIHQRFIVGIPEGFPLEAAGPVFCAGIVIIVIIIVVIIIIIRGPRMATRLLPTLLALISLFFPHCTALGKLQICYYQFTLHQIIKNLHFLLTFRMHVNIIHQHNYFNCIVYLFEYQSCNILFQTHLRFYEKSMEESSLPRMQDVFRVLTQFLSNNLTLFCPIQLPFKKVLICFLALALFFTITKF